MAFIRVGVQRTVDFKFKKMFDTQERMKVKFELRLGTFGLAGLGVDAVPGFSVPNIQASNMLHVERDNSFLC